MKSPNPKNNRNPKGLQPNQTRSRDGEIRPLLSFVSRSGQRKIAKKPLYRLSIFIAMKQEIRQNDITILHSEDGCSIPVIFNNLTGKNFKGKEYSDYVSLHSHSRHGIYLRENRILFRRKISHNGRNQAITFSFCFIAGSPGRVAIRPDFFFTVPLFFTGYFAGLLSFVSRSGKDKKQRNHFLNRIFSLLSS